MNNSRSPRSGVKAGRSLMKKSPQATQGGARRRSFTSDAASSEGGDGGSDGEVRDDASSEIDPDRDFLTRAELEAEKAEKQQAADTAARRAADEQRAADDAAAAKQHATEAAAAAKQRAADDAARDHDAAMRKAGAAIRGRELTAVAAQERQRAASERPRAASERPRGDDDDDGDELYGGSDDDEFDDLVESLDHQPAPPPPAHHASEETYGDDFDDGFEAESDEDDSAPPPGAKRRLSAGAQLRAARAGVVALATAEGGGAFVPRSSFLKALYAVDGVSEARRASLAGQATQAAVSTDWLRGEWASSLDRSALAHDAFDALGGSWDEDNDIRDDDRQRDDDARGAAERLSSEELWRALDAHEEAPSKAECEKLRGSLGGNVSREDFVRASTTWWEAQSGAPSEADTAPVPRAAPAEVAAGTANGRIEAPSGDDDDASGWELTTEQIVLPTTAPQSSNDDVGGSDDGDGGSDDDEAPAADEPRAADARTAAQQAASAGARKSDARQPEAWADVHSDARADVLADAGGGVTAATAVAHRSVVEDRGLDELASNAAPDDGMRPLKEAPNDVARAVAEVFGAHAPPAHAPPGPSLGPPVERTAGTLEARPSTAPPAVVRAPVPRISAGGDVASGVARFVERPRLAPARDTGAEDVVSLAAEALSRANELIREARHRDVQLTQLETSKLVEELALQLAMQAVGGRYPKLRRVETMASDHRRNSPGRSESRRASYHDDDGSAAYECDGGGARRQMRASYDDDDSRQSADGPPRRARQDDGEPPRPKRQDGERRRPAADSRRRDAPPARAAPRRGARRGVDERHREVNVADPVEDNVDTMDDVDGEGRGAGYVGAVWRRRSVERGDSSRRGDRQDDLQHDFTRRAPGARPAGRAAAKKAGFALGPSRMCKVKPLSAPKLAWWEILALEAAGLCGPHEEHRGGARQNAPASGPRPKNAAARHRDDGRGGAAHIDLRERATAPRAVRDGHRGDWDTKWPPARRAQRAPSVEDDATSAASYDAASLCPEGLGASPRAPLGWI
ncbi:hypothetical protein M885DRAFT_180619 [Pelagophyceae sp. CCMP2097]|nr:hypothetical protein M885DRAFT_180619 [Pelagophyceae sp. CCMP2097]